MTSLPVIGDLGAHALAYAARGLEVFPLRSDKTPISAAASQKQATTDPMLIAEWWARWPLALIGHRLPADQIILDVDPRHGGGGTWRALKETFDLPPTRVHLSGREDGGGHSWWKRPAAKLSTKRLDEWAEKKGVGYEVTDANGRRVRWTGAVDILQRDHRYTILPPSPHPDTGKPYRWKNALDVAPAVMPEGMAYLLTANEPTPAVQTVDLSRFDGVTDSIAEWWEQQHSWRDVLAPAGWTVVTGSGEDDGDQWRHPNATNPYSANIRHGQLFVYSSSTVFEVTDGGETHGYTRFHAWATLNFSGNRSDAGAEARREKNALTPSDRSRRSQIVEAEATLPDDRLGWWPTDLGPILAGTFEQPSPTILTIGDGLAGIFYERAVNGLYGDSNTGKTWVALAAIAEQLRRGKRAILLDYEASAPEAVARLRLLGVGGEGRRDEWDRLTYIQPAGRHGEIAMLPLLAAIDDDTTLVVVDSLGEAFGEEGIDENVDLDVGTWIRQVARVIADHGPAVVIIDHLTKAAENPWHPSGSKRKKAAITGAIYRVEALTAPSRDNGGTLVIKCAKDRHGTYAPKSIVALVDVRHSVIAPRLRITLQRPVEHDADDDPKLDRTLDLAVAVLVAEGEPLSQNELTVRLKGATDHKRAALAYGVRKGRLVETAGLRGARLFGLPIPTSPTSPDLA